MNCAQWSLIRRLAKCTFYPGSWPKRFVRDMAARAEAEDWYAVPLTPRQAAALVKVAHHYRRQLANIPDELKLAAEVYERLLAEGVPPVEVLEAAPEPKQVETEAETVRQLNLF